MAGHRCRKPCLEDAQVLLPPEVANGLGAGETEVAPRHADFGGGGADVEQADGVRTVLQILDQNLVTADFDLACLFAERVLVQFEHLVVGEQTQRELVEPFRRTADDQRRGPQAPEAEMGVLK